MGRGPVSSVQVVHLDKGTVTGYAFRESSGGTAVLTSRSKKTSLDHDGTP
jgi:hypothetical protein